MLCICYLFIFSMFEILQTLYWSIYGLVDLEHAELNEKHAITELIGKLMFGSYSFIAFIVLLNMLIAMMSNSYQIISVSIVCLFQFVWNIAEFVLGNLRIGWLRSCWVKRKAWIYRIRWKIDVRKLQFNSVYCIIKFADCYDEQFIHWYIGK